MTLTPKESLSILSSMLRIRRIEEAIKHRYKEQKMRCPIHLSIGQEAIAVGVLMHMQKHDGVFSHHRSHAHFLAKGGDAAKMIAELYGKKTGVTKGRGGSMHLIDLEAGFQGASPLAAGSIPLAAGWALAKQMQKNPSLCCVFFGDGATEEGVFAETLNFASLKKLPLLFVCENNQYAAHSPTKARQSSDERRIQMAAAHELFTSKGNGTDVEEVLHLTKEAFKYLRSGQGPAYLEFKTTRLCGHAGSRHDTKETPIIDAHCPIQTYQNKLFEREILTEELLSAMEEKIQKEIEACFSFAEESPFPLFDLDDEKAYAE